MKRLMIATMLIGALVVPGLANGLPKPPAQETTQESLLEQLTISAKDIDGETTASTLAANRVYRYEITGYWKPNGLNGHFVDAGFKTTNGTMWSKGIDKGLLIGNVNLGSLNQAPSQFNSDHLYSIMLAGRGVTENIRVLDDSYSDNENMPTSTDRVTVKIFEQRWVTYTIPILDLNTVVPLVVPVIGVSTPPIGGGTVGPVDPPGTSAPAGTVRLYRNGQGLVSVGVQGFEPLCLGITAAGNPEFTPFCAAAPSQVPSRTETVGGQSVDPDPICSTPCALPGVGPQSVSVGGDDHSFPAVLNVTLTWEADRTKLFYTPVNDALLNDGTPSGSNQLVLPFSSASSSWAQEEVAGALPGANPDSCHAGLAPKCSTELTLTLTVIVDGIPVAQNSIRVPLVGQVLEAMFLTKVNGI